MTGRNGMAKIESAQLAYASLLAWLVRIGLVLMLTGFALYASELLPASVPIDKVPEYWQLDSDTYAQVTGIERGWGWTSSLADSGVIAFAGLVFFPLAAIIAVLSAAVFYGRDGVAAYSVVALLEGAVLIVAATGIFGWG